jgi:orotidine-5'-phosphate decarboxylase
VRQRLALALDRPTLADAEELLRRLGRWFGVGKVGLELFVAAGPAAWAAVAAAGLGVFADLKLHDIPATVQGAARAAARGGADLLTVHLAGGPAMVTAAVAGFGEGAAAREAAGEPVRWRGPRGVLGVTVLTSEAEADPGVLAARAALAVEAGCVGLVCAARDQPVVADVAPTLLRVVPGVRLAGGARQDQARVATPAEAIGGGAGLLVIGRAVTAAENPGAAAAAVAAEVQGALEGPDAPAGEAGAAGA